MKQWLSLVLTLCLILSVTPISVAAAQTEIPLEGFALIDGVDYVPLTLGETYTAEFECYPENTTDTITLTADRADVQINGFDICPQSAGDIGITATATSGVTYEFTVHVRDAAGLTITKMPYKTTYAVGEALNMNGAEVQVTYTDGTQETVSDYSILGYNSATVGTQAVEVRWVALSGKSVSSFFDVTVSDTKRTAIKVHLLSKPTKREYARREQLDLSGLSVMVEYDDGSSDIVTDYTVSGYNSLKIGLQVISVTYDNQKASFLIAVDQTLVAGDITCDGKLNTQDVRSALRKMVALDGGFTAVEELLVDMDEDGNVRSSDIRRMFLILFENSHLVTFKDYDGRVLKAEIVEHGQAAIPPEAPTRTGYLFDGWDKAFDNVTTDFEVTAKYSPRADYHFIIYRNLNGAPTPEVTGYLESEGLYDMPEPVAPGYQFKGWYTASEGGIVVDYIPVGSTQDYILYAKWEQISYAIRYIEAAVNDNPATYTVEDDIYLNTPNWSGLGFTGWTEDNNKIVTEVRDGKTYYKIPAGTTGDLVLTAHWKLMRNIATPGTNDIVAAEYMEESGRYMFIYELGTIENVVIEEMSASNLYNHTGAGDFTLTMSVENTMEESVADSITKTISKSVSSSSEWESSKEWAKEKSNEYAANASYGMEFGGDASPVKSTIELEFGYTHSSSSSWGGSETKGGSIGEETETGEEVGSCFSYLTSMTTTSETSVTISGDSPYGYYDYVQVGNIRVFGVVTYDPKDGNYYLNTYSILDNMHGMVLYYPDVNALNNPTCETLQYRIPEDDIEEKIANSYYISYDPNGGTGKANSSVHTTGGSEKLTANTFVRPGYTFVGWEMRDENGLSIATFSNEQVINTNLAKPGEVVKIYAVWDENDYTLEYDGNKPVDSTSPVENVPANTVCVYDRDVTLANAPVMAGYSFQGWYYTDKNGNSVRLGDGGETLTKPNLSSELNGIVRVYARWTPNEYTLTFDLGVSDATCGETSRIVTYDSYYMANGLPTPTASKHLFMGWTLNGVDVNDLTRVNIAGDHSLKAKWLPLTWSETRGNGKNKRFRMITDRDDFWTELDEDWNPNISKELLEKEGYTKVIITISFWVDELDQGNQRVYFASPGGMEMCKWSFTSTPSSWHQYTRSTANESYRYIDISNFGDNMEFKTIWEAYGNGGDSWDLGETTITLEFVKG